MNKERQQYQGLDEYIFTMLRPYTHGTNFELEVVKEICPLQL